MHWGQRFTVSTKHFGFEPTPHAENSGVGSSSSFFFKDVFIYFWLCWGFAAAHGLSLVL